MSDLSPEARALLESTRRAGGPTAAQRAAMKKAVVAATLAPASAAASTGASTTVTTGAKATGLWLAAKLGLVLVALGGLGAAVAWKLPALGQQSAPVWTPPPAAEVAPPALQVDAVKAELIEPEAMLPPLQVVPPAPIRVAKAAKVESVPSQDEVPPAPVAPHEEATLSREVAALSRAMKAVDEKQYAAALEQVAGYRAEFPTGALGTEAGVVEVLALCGTGQADAARAAAQSLPANNPAVRRLERSCIAAPQKAPQNPNAPATQ